MNNISYQELPVITGDKVRLRPVGYDDTELVVKWRNSPEVKCNFIFRDEMTTQMHLNWMKNKVEKGEVIQYIIENLEDNKPVGSVYFRDVDIKNESAEYGIFIGENQARGKGIGSETAKLFTEFGLNYIGLHRISLRVIAGNDAAYRSYEKAGFIKEGVFKDMVKLDGKFCDIIFMAKLS